jgi:hypothetical protein
MRALAALSLVFGLLATLVVAGPTNPCSGILFCQKDVSVTFDDTFNVRNFVHWDKDLATPVDWRQVTFVSTPAWNSLALETGQTITFTDALPGDIRIDMYCVSGGARIGTLTLHWRTPSTAISARCPWNDKDLASCLPADAIRSATTNGPFDASSLEFCAQNIPIATNAPVDLDNVLRLFRADYRAEAITSPYSFSVTPSSGASVNADNVFVATSAGTYTVTVSTPTLGAEDTLTIVASSSGPTSYTGCPQEADIGGDTNPCCRGVDGVPDGCYVTCDCNVFEMKSLEVDVFGTATATFRVCNDCFSSLSYVAVGFANGDASRIRSPPQGAYTFAYSGGSASLSVSYTAISNLGTFVQFTSATPLAAFSAGACGEISVSIADYDATVDHFLLQAHEGAVWETFEYDALSCLPRVTGLSVSSCPTGWRPASEVDRTAPLSSCVTQPLEFCSPHLDLKQTSVFNIRNFVRYADPTCWGHTIDWTTGSAAGATFNSAWHQTEFNAGATVSIATNDLSLTNASRGVRIIPVSISGQGFSDSMTIRIDAGNNAQDGQYEAQLQCLIQQIPPGSPVTAYCGQCSTTTCCRPVLGSTEAYFLVNDGCTANDIPSDEAPSHGLTCDCQPIEDWCPNMCSGRGICNRATGSCDCAITDGTQWMGLDCNSWFLSITVQEVCFQCTTYPDVFAVFEQTIDHTANNGRGTVTVRATLSTSFTDNSYGPGVGWENSPSRQHTFPQLIGSDHLEMQMLDKSGTAVLGFDVDTISYGGVSCKSLGVWGQEGKMSLGSSSYILSATTSLSKNFNDGLAPGSICPGYTVAELEVSSPITNDLYGIKDPKCPDWEFVQWYEVVVDCAVFGGTGCSNYGEPAITGIHASPSKKGINTCPVVKTYCDSLQNRQTVPPTPVYDCVPEGNCFGNGICVDDGVCDCGTGYASPDCQFVTPQPCYKYPSCETCLPDDRCTWCSGGGCWDDASLCESQNVGTPITSQCPTVIYVTPSTSSPPTPTPSPVPPTPSGTGSQTPTPSNLPVDGSARPTESGTPSAQATPPASPTPSPSSAPLFCIGNNCPVVTTTPTGVPSGSVITFLDVPPCPDGCFNTTNQGECVNSTCVCAEGYSGVNCGNRPSAGGLSAAAAAGISVGVVAAIVVSSCIGAAAILLIVGVVISSSGYGVYKYVHMADHENTLMMDNPEYKPNPNQGTNPLFSSLDGHKG